LLRILPDETKGNYSGAKNNNNLLIMNDFKYFSCFLQSNFVVAE